ncbi:MAG: hypothetical protein KF799_04495 [Bdellovibrionales bacterium]|nr:hypothetical protein [Bdellovibrionales bacterium]
MDAAFPLAGLISEFNELTEARDFEGAEELLSGALSASSQYEAFLHFQLGRLYTQWNKMTSAVNHLSRASELAFAASDHILLLQISEELKTAKRRQAGQRP